MGLFDFFKRSKPNTTPQREPTRHCFVLCPQADAGDLSRANDVVTRILGPEYSAEVTSDGTDMVTITGNGGEIGVLAHMPIAIPEGEAAAAADDNFLWPNGREQAEQHQSHLIVTLLGETDDDSVSMALAVSRLALVALDLFDGIGVYWGNASVSHSRELFEDLCEDMSEEHLPVPAWLRLQFVRRPESDQVGLYTLGMQQFGLMDIEVDSCPMTPEEMFSFVADIAHYLIRTGPVVADGHTVGGSEEQRILVRHQPSMIDNQRLVYKLVFEST